jgi:hypothetical protein
MRLEERRIFRVLESGPQWGDDGLHKSTSHPLGPFLERLRSDEQSDSRKSPSRCPYHEQASLHQSRVSSGEQRASWKSMSSDSDWIRELRLSPFGLW